MSMMSSQQLTQVSGQTDRINTMIYELKEQLGKLEA
jgi:hypothetical protein